MPRNKRESLIYTVLMCGLMVLWMSIYNISLQEGKWSLAVVQKAWLGFPLGFVIAMCCDWFIVSGPAKATAFKYLIKPWHSDLKKVVAVSTCMVLPMVFIMSLYGSLEAVMGGAKWTELPLIWLFNIPKNLVMALPFQLLIAGPIVRKVFRRVFPVGTVLA